MTDDTKLKLSEIAKLRKGPEKMSLTKACKQAGISVNTFYYWQNPKKIKVKGKISAKAKKKLAPYVQEVSLAPVQSNNKLVCLIGSASDIARIVGSLN